MRSISGIWLAIGLATCVIGCDASDEEEARVLCTTICRCTEVPLPGMQEECVDQCSMSNAIQNASQACSECIFTHADRCGSLENDCDRLCDPPQPLPEEGLTGGGDR